MKVALVHDYLYTFGGAERVLDALHQIYPQAPIYTAWADFAWIKKTKPAWRNWDIRPSWFQKLPQKKQLTSPLRFLAPYIWESLDLSAYDLVISSAAWFITKGIITSPDTLHICYCHTPPRYLYGYPTARNLSNPLIKAYANLVNPALRKYDLLSSRRVDKFVCNSKEVQKRIKKIYHRTATVIHPPVSLPAHQSSIVNHKSDNYFLIVSRLARMKRIDIAIKAALKTQVNLKIIGAGPEQSHLKALSRGAKNITFLGFIPDSELNRYYGNATALINLADQEDFGITPIEAAYFATPTIGANSGGLPETIIHNKTGLLINQPTPKKLTDIINNFEPRQFSPSILKAHAKKFSRSRFKKEIKSFVEKEFKKLDS